VIILVFAGALFFLAGTVGLLRFPDVFTRLHALTKADNVGLGLVVMALAAGADSWAVRAKLVLIWILVMAAASIICHVIARSALREGLQPWRRP
jgi:multicomponent Na+:H+ antiporter subunit G